MEDFYCPTTLSKLYILAPAMYQSVFQNVLQYLKVLYSSRKLYELVEAVGISCEQESWFVT